MHLKYTAREGGETLAAPARTAARAQLAAIAQASYTTSGVHYGFSLRHDMPNEWHTFKQSGTVDFNVLRSRLPYVLQAIGVDIINFKLFVDTNIAYNSQVLNITYNHGSASQVHLAQISSSITALSGYFAPTSHMSFGLPITIAEDSTFSKADINDITFFANIKVTP